MPAQTEVSRKFDRNDIQFAIGSATKAFTALSVSMSQDDGKLSLSDPPKKYLPYFKMYDPETDKNITIRDLLRHASGLNRTDLAMVTGKLTRAELIEVAGQAKPTAKLREKFQYQNMMFTAAGEIAAVAQKQPWETLVARPIFAPLGMANTSISTKRMQRVDNIAVLSRIYLEGSFKCETASDIGAKQFGTLPRYFRRSDIFKIFKTSF